MIGPTDDYTPDDSDAPDAPPPGPVRVVRDDEAPPPEWSRALACNEHGIPTKDPGNAALILTQSQAWSGALEHDVFAGEIQARSFPPLPRLPDGWPTLPPPPAGELCDQHLVYAGLWLRRAWSQSWGPEAVRAALDYAARANPVHPLRDYLDACSVQWDGVPRVEGWLQHYFDAESRTPVQGVYLANVGRWWLISAVARALTPGCKVDHVLVLEGAQGAGKNQGIEALFSPWYLPELPDLRDKDAMHALGGIWCAMNDELGATRRSDIERNKSFFTRNEDVYRAPYTRNFVRRPRSCVFAATTNEVEYLLDVENRRWWPVRVRTVRVDELRRDRDQLWGEAVELYRAGNLWYPDASLRGALVAEQSARVHGDLWDERIVEYLEAHPSGVRLAEIATNALLIEPSHQTPGDAQRISRCLRRNGWSPRRRSSGGSRSRLWEPEA